MITILFFTSVFCFIGTGKVGNEKLIEPTNQASNMMCDWLILTDTINLDSLGRCRDILRGRGSSDKRALFKTFFEQKSIYNSDFIKNEKLINLIFLAQTQFIIL